MRFALIAAVCIPCVEAAAADDVGAAAKKPTHIAAQGLSAALNQLAQSRGLQVLYLSNTVRDLQTHGANGDMTANEAFDRLLDGTGLTYRYLDGNTVTVVPIGNTPYSDGTGVPPQSSNGAPRRAPPTDGASSSSKSYLLAQASPAQGAQRQGPSADDAPPPSPLQEIIVTGSRIAAPNEVSTSPIQVVTSKDIRVYGKTDVSDLINLLPQNFTNDLGQDLGNGSSGLTTAGGVATADLRGLGPGRTLVLIDGRRLGVGSPNTAISQPAPDLDQIPAGLVQRVEVVTGGASAAYGSDAIAGVVNFIMKRDFQGFQIDGQIGENYHDNHDSYLQGLARQFDTSAPVGTAQDGRNRTFDMLMGTNFADGNGNITAYMSYRHTDPVVSSQRDYGACQINPVLEHNAVTGLICGGSTNSNWFRPATGPKIGDVYSVFGNDFVPLGSVPTTPPADYNSQQYIYLTREDDRYNAAFLAHDDINDYFKPYAELFFMDDKTHQQSAPAALFKDANPLDPTGAGDYFINCSNPLLSTQQQGILCTPAQIAADTAHPGAASAQVEIGRRNIEGGPRETRFEHTNYRAVFGSKGEFADVWSYDAYGQYFYTSFNDSNEKYLNFQAISNALQVTGTPVNPRCISGALGCVPYNIFSDGTVTQQQLAYLYELGTAQGSSSLRTLHADVTGKLGEYGIKSPLAAEGLAVNVGFEHREDHVFLLPDAAEESGLLSGFGSAVAPIDNSISVSEEFAELRAPLLQDQVGAKELLFDTGLRRSDYSTVGTQNTYKFEVQYAPIADYRLRASYDKAIRAPSVAEAFTPPIVGTVPVGRDPCAPPITLTLLECERTHVTATQFNDGSIPQGVASQLSAQSSGNPDLKPEQGTTYTIGLNFAPRQIPRLSGSIDYYHIQIKDEIGTYPYNVILFNCATTGNPVYCSQIVRQPTTGSLTGNSNTGGGYVIQKNYNLGTAINSGIDVQLAYKLELARGLGDMSFDLSGVYLLHNETQPLPGAHTYDCVGLFGASCETVNPRWHHLFRTTWDTPWDVSASLTWRFIGPVTEDNNTSDPTLQNVTYVGFDYATGRIPGYNYLDLETTWTVNRVLQLRVGADNILDKDPPLVNSFAVSGGSANTYSVYDLFGRQLFVAFSAKF